VGRIQERTWDKGPNGKRKMDHGKDKRVQRTLCLCFIDYAKAYNSVEQHEMYGNTRTINRINKRPIHRAISQSAGRTRHNRFVPNTRRLYFISGCF
jgi:hypothetical protein